MKAFVLIWLGGLAVIGLVSVLYPTTQADALAVSVNRNEDAVTALSKRMDEITGKQAGISENAKALRVYVDEREDGTWRHIAEREHRVMMVVWAAFALAGLALIYATVVLIRTIRKGGRVEHK